jgi:hypothetical protein
VSTLQPFQLGNNAMAKGLGDTPLAKDVSLGSTDFTNGAHHRLPWAVSRDLQAVAMSGKELYFRVTDDLLKDVAHGGGVQTGFDFAFSMADGTAVPYVIKSYDGAAGTLMGVFNPKALAGSAAATRGYLYFNNPAWTVSKEEPDQTFPNATSVLFLPSGVDRSGSKLDFDADLPTSDKVIVNPGALVDGSQVAGNDIERALVGDCGSFLISFLCQSIPNSVDNSPLTFGSGTGTTVIYLRHCFATPNGPHPTTDITNCWRVGFATGGKETDYETAQDTADQTLQHIVFRRVLGSRPELYINGVLSPFSFSFEDTGILSSRLDFTNQKLIVGRGSVASSRWWNGYLDCFKFFKDDAKSATWALAEYSNLMDIDGGVIFGSPETVSTSSVFGETIKVQADQLTSVDFKADKYSATVGGTIALRASAPFDNPANGRFTDRGANTVRYTNTKAVNPDNDGAIHLTNGVGSVVIPVRAKIILTAPPPVSGYYKTPNTFVGDVTTKTVNTVNSRSELQTLLNSIPNTAWAATNCIKLSDDWGAPNINGSRFTINKGGTATDPLVIFMDNAGSDTAASWSGRPTIYNNPLVLAAPYVWLYGIQTQLLPKDVYQHWPTSDGSFALIELKAANCFVTASHLCGSRHVYNDPTTAYAHDFQGNYNWFEWKFQSTASVGDGDHSFYSEGRKTSSPKISQRWITARNRWTDYPTQFSKPNDWPDGTNFNLGSNARCFYIGNGWGTDETITSEWEIYYNFIDGSASHIGEFKGGIKAFKWNHCPGTDRGLGRPYGGAYTRGGSSTGGEFMYNRLNCQLSMVNGDNSTYVSHWMVDGSGNPTGTFGPTCRSTEASTPKPKGLRGADGTTWIDCKVATFLLPYYFENRTSYPPTVKLGSIAPMLIAGMNSGCTFKCGDESPSSLTDGTPLSFDTNGHPTGSNTRDLSKADITKQSANPGSYTLEVPPILNATVCGPGAVGKTWGT